MNLYYIGDDQLIKNSVFLLVKVRGLLFMFTYVDMEIHDEFCTSLKGLFVSLVQLMYKVSSTTNGMKLE